MEQWLIHVLETAAWIGGLLVLFAVIGVVATIRWIIGLFWRGEQAVETGVKRIEDSVTRR